MRGGAISDMRKAQRVPWRMSADWISIGSLMVLGLVLGLKHALDADHVAAVATIVSERRSWLSSSLVGALWGVGHTLSLLIAGVAVIVLHIQVGARLALALEFGVAVMLIGLGANALRAVARGGRVHLHVHEHDGRSHWHPHAHESEAALTSHHRIGVRPLLVGMMHGFAGSAAVMLLVLASIPSPLIGFAYIGVFGIGSIGGMLVMSALVSLPARLTAARFARAHVAVRTLAALFSLGLGLSMAYQIGVVDGLFV
jgi:sulfite exporter TauE/SafE